MFAETVCVGGEGEAVAPREGQGRTVTHSGVREVSSGFSDGKCQYFPEFRLNIQNKSNFCHIFGEQ